MELFQSTSHFSALFLGISGCSCEIASDDKKAAAAVGEKAVSMIKEKELLPLTGYVHGGCSPIGMKKLFPTVIHESALQFDTILCSAGKIGHQLEVSPLDIQKVTGCTFADIIE